MLLVEETGDDDGHGDSVEDGEDPDPQDQLLQFVSLAAVLLHHRPDLDQGEQASHQEN